MNRPWTASKKYGARWNEVDRERERERSDSKEQIIGK